MSIAEQGQVINQTLSGRYPTRRERVGIRRFLYSPSLLFRWWIRI